MRDKVTANSASLAQASTGRNPDELAECAARGGYDLSPVRSLLDMLSSVR